MSLMNSGFPSHTPARAEREGLSQRQECAPHAKPSSPAMRWLSCLKDVSGDCTLWVVCMRCGRGVRRRARGGVGSRWGAEATFGGGHCRRLRRLRAPSAHSHDSPLITESCGCVLFWLVRSTYREARAARALRDTRASPLPPQAGPDAHLLGRVEAHVVRGDGGEDARGEGRAAGRAGESCSSRRAALAKTVQMGGRRHLLHLLRPRLLNASGPNVEIHFSRWSAYHWRRWAKEGRP